MSNGEEERKRSKSIGSRGERGASIRSGEGSRQVRSERSRSQRSFVEKRDSRQNSEPKQANGFAEERATSQNGQNDQEPKQAQPMESNPEANKPAE